MYEMMTGVVPFEGETAISVALQHVQDDIPLPTKYNRRIPRLVEQCILKAMAKNPDDRFQSIAEMMSELRLSQGFVNTNKGAMPIIKNNFATQKLPPLKSPEEDQKKNIFSLQKMRLCHSRVHELAAAGANLILRQSALKLQRAASRRSIQKIRCQNVT